jgi:hypothetical protein
MTVRRRIALLIAIAIAPACSQDRKADGQPERGAVATRPAEASGPTRSYSCREVAHHFVVRYLTLRQGDDLAVHFEKDCELNDWTQEERACWMQVRDMASHQRCLTEFADPRMRRPDYKTRTTTRTTASRTTSTRTRTTGDQRRPRERRDSPAHRERS